MQVKITNTSDNPTPECKSKNAAGFDIAAFILNENKKVTIEPSEQKLIATGLFMEIPDGYYLQLKSRSGLAKERNLHVTAGVVDSDYRGQIHVLLINHSKEKQVIESGDRIAQGIIIPYVQVEFHVVSKLSETMRGDGSFGSTGIGGEQSKAASQPKERTAFMNTKRTIDIGSLKEGDEVYLRGEGYPRKVKSVKLLAGSSYDYNVSFEGQALSVNYFMNGLTDWFAHHDDIVQVNGIEVKEA